MPYPLQTFSTFAELLTYINNNVVTNGDEEIDAVIVNNVVNGLLTFISQSPLNYQKADLYTSGGIIVTTNPVNVFTNTTPTTLSWENNIYNQVIFINTTGNAIPLDTGVTYKNIYLVSQNNIPANSVISLVKAENDLWIQTNVDSGGGQNISFGKVQFKVGDVDAPMVQGEDTLIIEVANPMRNSCDVFLDGIMLYEDQDDQISYLVTYGSNEITINFNQGVNNGQKYRIKYATN